MRQNRYIYRLARGLSAREIGNKAHSLLFLQKHKFRIPKTFVVSAAAFEEYQNEATQVLQKLKTEIAELPKFSYAVRSSTCAEDSAQHSFAGQFQTFTDVSNEPDICDSIVNVWKSSVTTSETEYQRQISFGNRKIRCAVILQEMVQSKLSGVSFSKNPVTNQNEVIIEAVEGLGENLVQKGLTPFRWRFKKDKLIEGPGDFQQLQLIRKIARDTLRLKMLFGNHVDIEWAFDGENLFYLQLRSIVGKDRLPVYSNKMAQEMLPGQIKPLVWSINIPLVNGTWINILSRITGKLSVRPEDLTKSFYYRTYFNMAQLGEIFKEFGLPPDSLEYMMGEDKKKKPMFMPGFSIFKHTFRIIRFINTTLHFEAPFLKELPALQERYDVIASKIRNDFSVSSFQELYTQLFKEGQTAAYMNIVVPLLMRMHNKKLSKRLKNINVSYDLLDFRPDFPELADLSPFLIMETIKQKIDNLPDGIRDQCSSFAALASIPQASNIVADFNRLIRQFGHLSDSGNDCSVPKWEENPEQVFKLTVNYSPKISQREMFTFNSIKYSKFRHPGLKKLYIKAGKFKIYRERISSLYIYGYGLFRSLFLALSDEFVRNGIIDNREDIFYLKKEEVDFLIPDLAVDPQQINYRQLIESRKTEMEESREIILPAVIYGEEAPILEKGQLRNFKGVGTSPGSYTGKTKIIRGTSDFDRVVRGDVLIIPFSDVSWTPVLALAGAIVSESGGMLSHCSIISRELGIPALVSVENACALDNDMMVTIDGSNGILTVHDYE